METNNESASNATHVDSLIISEEPLKQVNDKQSKIQKRLESDFNPVYLQFDTSFSKTRSRYGRARTSLNQSLDSCAKHNSTSDNVDSTTSFIETNRGGSNNDECLKSSEILDKLFHENRKSALLSRSKIISKYRELFLNNNGHSTFLLENSGLYNYEKKLNKTMPNPVNHNTNDIENRENFQNRKNRRKSYSAPTRISIDKLHEPLIQHSKTDGLTITNNLTPYNIYKEEILSNQLGRNKSNPLMPSLIVNEPFYSIVDDEWSEGDICWGRIGSYPFWPCLICDDPATGSFVKIIEPKPGRSSSQVKYYHVRFFADNGRRCELKSHCLIPFTTLEDFKKRAEEITPELRRKSPKHCSAFIVPPSRYVCWKNAIEEASVVIKRPKIYRLDYFNTINYSNETKLNMNTKTSAAYTENNAVDSSDAFDKLIESMNDNNILKTRSRKQKYSSEKGKSEVPKKKRKIISDTDDPISQTQCASELRDDDKTNKLLNENSNNLVNSPDKVDYSFSLSTDKACFSDEQIFSLISPVKILRSSEKINKGETRFVKSNAVDALKLTVDGLSRNSLVVEAISFDKEIILNTQLPDTNSLDLSENLYNGDAEEQKLISTEFTNNNVDHNQSQHNSLVASSAIQQNGSVMLNHNDGKEIITKNSSKILTNEIVLSNHKDEKNPNEKKSNSEIDDKGFICNKSPSETSMPKLRRVSRRSAKLNELNSNIEKPQTKSTENLSAECDIVASEETWRKIMKVDVEDSHTTIKCEIKCDDYEILKGNAILPIAHSSKNLLDDKVLKNSNTAKIKQAHRRNSRKSSVKEIDVSIKSSRISGNLSDSTSESEMKKKSLKKYKSGLFQGLCREHVCVICEKSGGLLKCKGSCSNYYHYECAFPNESYIEEKTTVDKDVFEEHVSTQMQEIMCSIPNRITSSESSSDDTDDDEEIGCKIIQMGKPSFSSKFSVNRMNIFKCGNCSTNRKPKCFICHSESYGNEKKTDRQKCCMNQCGNFFHMECLKVFPQTKMNFGLLLSKKSVKAADTFVCAHHVCHTCVSDNPHGNKSRFLNEKLSKCIKCPTAYHTDIHCIPAGTVLLTASQIICTKHFDISKKSKAGLIQHLNVIWCFICAVGGSLICCEMCPTAFHVECLGVPQPEGKYICEDCEAGRFPLYNEVVWCKMATFRWWPARILPPYEIPPKVYKVQHEPGNFCVRFFGSLDHHWTTRGKVFLFFEGDTAYTKSIKNNLDGVFVTAVNDANAVYNEFKSARELHTAKIAEDLKPPYYIKIKTNRFIGGVKALDADQSFATACECNPNSLNPCGPNSYCLNRILLYECNPMICPAGDKCCNQDFEKRQYPPLTPFMTKGKGWGLKTLTPLTAGQFIIEYVGDVIDNVEFNRRLEIKHKARDENFYFLVLDKDRIIDAGPKGNVSRFMNHSCDPNCETQKWTVNGDTRVGLFAIKNIEADTELTFNYNLESTGGEEKKHCYCGAAQCAGFIGAKKNSKAKKKKL